MCVCVAVCSSSIARPATQLILYTEYFACDVCVCVCLLGLAFTIVPHFVGVFRVLLPSSIFGTHAHTHVCVCVCCHKIEFTVCFFSIDFIIIVCLMRFSCLSQSARSFWLIYMRKYEIIYNFIYASLAIAGEDRREKREQPENETAL